MTSFIEQVERIFRRDPDLVIGDPSNPYMFRWNIIPKNRLLNIFLHKFVRDDDDRAMHDHPWWSMSIVLRSGYYDCRPGPDKTEERRWYGPGSIIFRYATDRHRVELFKEVWPVFEVRDHPDGRYSDVVDVKEVPRDSWTLFITGPKVREWGFWCPQGWRHWTDFTSGKNGEVIGKGCGE